MYGPEKLQKRSIFEKVIICNARSRYDSDGPEERRGKAAAEARRGADWRWEGPKARRRGNASRGAAEEVLRRLIDNAGAMDLSAAAETEVVDIPASLPRDWVALYEAAFGSERELLVALAEAGTPRPEVGFESAGGVPISIAWPDRLIAALKGRVAA